MLQATDEEVLKNEGPLPDL